jgi:hypothetical protein
MEEVSKKEIKYIIAYFKRDKNSRLKEWLVEIFLMFYKQLKKDLLRVIEKVKNYESF